MRSESILVILISFCCSANAFLKYVRENIKKSDILQGFDYTFYQIEIEWPGSVCKYNKCDNEYLGNFDGSTFNLHGVWATGSPSNHCQYQNDCQNLPFDYSQISQDLQAELNKYWVGVFNPTKNFLKHEWQKHGVCWNDDLNPINGSLTYKQYINDYFSLGIGIVTTFNPLPIWNGQGIVPSDNKSYNYKTVISALVHEFGEGVVGKCEIVNGQQLLHSIDFCLGLDYAPIDCPCRKSKKSNCKFSEPIYINKFVKPK